ncbi:hypothetical protein HUU40_19595 [candidate division KSB1 bacterium]|nr:hypothetical protein [candidate division KSB1 bacterium]
MVQVEIQKPPLPILWLDTSIILKIAMWKAGLKLNPTDRERIPRLFEECLKVAEANKIIFPIGDQQEEIWKGEEICHAIAAQLSLGVKFRHHISIQDSQINTFMQAYIKRQTTVSLDHQDAFLLAPIDAISRSQFQTPFYSILPSRVQTINDIKKSREQIRCELEKIKSKARGIAYEEQLLKEYQGKTEAFSIITETSLKNQMLGLPLSIAQYEGLKNFYRFVTLWDGYGGNPAGSEGLMEFLNSEYYRSIPQVSIQCKLGALLLTDSSKLEDGDSMDIVHISSVLPYCAAILVDRKMKNRCHNLKLAETYRTRIFSLNEFDEVMKFLRSPS